jgi:hypothetical protein
MNVMRRIGTLLVALGYGFSFVAVCLSACLMGPAAADHGCCPGEDGIRAAGRDCCSVTPGESHGGTHVADTSAVHADFASVVVTVSASVVTPTPVAVSSSPPLILRV